MREYGSNINLPSLDNLFSSEQERQDAKLEKIQILPLTELHPFRITLFKSVTMTKWTKWWTVSRNTVS